MLSEKVKRTIQHNSKVLSEIFELVKDLRKCEEPSIDEKTSQLKAALYGEISAFSYKLNRKQLKEFREFIKQQEKYYAATNHKTKD